MNAGDPTSIQSAKELGQLARSARLRSRLSQREVAGLSGVGLRFVSDLENGKPTLRLDKALTVLSALGIGLFAADRPRSLGKLSANVRRFERRAEQSEARTNLSSIHDACRAFREAEGRYPRTLREAGGGEWRTEGASRYVYLLNAREIVGGEGSPDRRRLAGIAKRVLREHGIRVGSRKNTFVAAAVTYREGEATEGDAEVDVWTIDASRTLVNRTPAYAERD